MTAFLDSIGGGGGGGGAVTSFKTVGSGLEDYATVQAGITAGFYNLRITSSITETVSIAAFPNQDVTIEVDGSGITWTFGLNVSFSSASYLKTFTLNLNGGTVAWGNSSTGTHPLELGGGVLQGVVAVYGGGRLLNTSTANTTHFIKNVNQTLSGHYEIYPPNQIDGGLGSVAKLESAHFIGGGAFCSNAIALSGENPSRVETLRFSGIWDTFGQPWEFFGHDIHVGEIDIKLTSSAFSVVIPPLLNLEILNADFTSRLIGLTDGGKVYGGKVDAACTYAIPAFGENNTIWRDVVGSGFNIEPGRISYKTISTTDSTQTELTIVGTNRFTLADDTTAIVNIKILAQRDNQDWASFQWLGAIIANDGGAYTATNVTASAGPDHSKGTGSSPVIALDAFSGLRIQVTGNAAENWKWQTEIEFVTATN